MDQLDRAKRRAHLTLTRLYDTADKTSDFSDIPGVEAAYTELKEIFDQINKECADAQMASYDVEWLTVIDKHQEFRKRFVNPAPMQAPAVTPGTQASISDDLTPKLPPIHLPTFEGNRADYHNFIAKFTTAVHDKPIDNILKLQYLLGCLHGKPQQLVAHLTLTRDNYDKALIILKEKYENRRKLIFGLLTTLFDLPKAVTSASLEDLTDNIVGIYHALESHGSPIDNNNILFIYLMLQKLDSASSADYYKKIGKNIPTVPDFLEFLQSRLPPEDILGHHVASKKPNSSVQIGPKQGASDNHTPSSSKQASSIDYIYYCPACSEEHQAVSCTKFMSLDQNSRRDLILQKRLCYNCMRPGHATSSCPTSSRCKKCSFKHHTLLHRVTSSSQENNTTAHALHNTNILPTAIVPVRGQYGHIVHLRALLDTGSTSSFISQGAADELQSPKLSIKETIYGVNGHMQDVKQAIKMQIAGEQDFMELTAMIVPEVTKQLPAHNTPLPEFPGLTLNQFADPTFNRRGPIDLLLSSNAFFAFLRPGPQHTSKDKAAIAVLTRFGYVVASKQLHVPSPSLSYHCTIEDDFKKLWALEQTTARPTHPDDQLCEERFQIDTNRRIDGSYEVHLPIVKSTEHLHKTRSIALRRLFSIDRTLEKRGLRDAYNEQLLEYIHLNHMESAPPTYKDVCYLPHHAVFKAKSTTTKMRIVFDASAAPKEEMSLNDTMLNGPRLQDPLANILIRFRKFPIALTADVVKMYRHIHIHPDQYDLHRILWRFQINAPIEEFRLKTLTFGTKAAPFLATRVLQQLSEDEKNNYPNAARILKNDFYIDDCMTGAESLDEARNLRLEIDQLLCAGGFQLQKWNSNISELCPEQHIKEVKNEDSITTLGLVWVPERDTFAFAINNMHNSKYTKRRILSEAAQLFDPLGWATPVTMFSRVFLQDLWKHGYQWDDLLPTPLQEQWRAYQDEIQGLRDVSIPRYINYSPQAHTKLCGFSDASCKAMAACVYLVSHQKGTITSYLVAARGKVAPLKSTTIPKLELSAATLLVNFMEEVKTALRLPTVETHYWTDSTITLAWIQSPSYKWETFVANRVATIQALSNANQWHHVSSQENPADLATRTMSASQLTQSSLWWKGPALLLTNTFNHLTNSLELPAESRCHLIIQSTPPPQLPISTCSTLNKLCRVYAYIIRFCAKIQKKPCASGPIIPGEYSQALRFIVFLTQHSVFYKEIKCLNAKRDLPKDSKLKTLSPFLDSNGCLRILGRLANANIPYDQKHPLIIPHTGHLTTLLVEHYHREHLHAGTTLLLASLRNKFWIIGGKRAVKKITHKCMVCHRLKATMATQIMGNLPEPRTTPSRPFTNTGLDYAGPIQLRPIVKRSPIRLKGYICIFVCLATKAIHLEPVSDMTSEAFIAALRRFIARRGTCETIWSDNGATFVGADTVLKELLDNSYEVIQDLLTPNGIKWSFIPPYSPHFGGLWEAGVKSVKYHLKRVMGATALTFEELCTALTQIEACLNSRPLCPLTEDPDDLATLTPGHFLIGAPLTAPPDADLRNIPENRLNRWQLLQKMSQEFWNRWQQEYLHQLQNRPKWFKPTPNLLPGTIVIIHDSKAPPTCWNLGRIVEVHPGTDNNIRVVTIKTARALIQRPITKVSPLPI